MSIPAALLFWLGLTLLFQSPDLSRAESLIDAGHWKGARAVLEQCLRESPGDPQVMYLLAQVKMAFGGRDEALKLAQAAAGIGKRNADYHFLVARIFGEIAENDSALRQVIDGMRFKREAEATLSLDPRHLDARFALMLFYSKAPAVVGGSRKRAHAIADEMVNIDPWEGHMAFARLAQEEGDAAGVESSFLKAVNVAPGEYDSQIGIAEFYATEDQKRYAQAETHARMALIIDRRRAAAYAILATVMARQHRLPELDKILAEGEANDPDDFRPYYEAALALLEDGTEMDRAERYLRKYVTQEPEGNAPGLGIAHWQIARVLERRGLKSQAVAELTTALRLDPNLEGAKTDLRRLR